MSPSICSFGHAPSGILLSHSPPRRSLSTSHPLKITHSPSPSRCCSFTAKPGAPSARAPHAHRQRPRPMRRPAAPPRRRSFRASASLCHLASVPSAPSSTRDRRSGSSPRKPPSSTRLGTECPVPRRAPQASCEITRADFPPAAASLSSSRLVRGAPSSAHTPTVRLARSRTAPSGQDERFGENIAGPPGELPSLRRRRHRPPP